MQEIASLSLDAHLVREAVELFLFANEALPKSCLVFQECISESLLELLQATEKLLFPTSKPFIEFILIPIKEILFLLKICQSLISFLYHISQTSFSFLSSFD